jgi:hypothetical protein
MIERGFASFRSPQKIGGRTRSPAPDSTIDVS